MHEHAHHCCVWCRVVKQLTLVLCRKCVIYCMFDDQALFILLHLYTKAVNGSRIDSLKIHGSKHDELEWAMHCSRREGRGKACFIISARLAPIYAASGDRLSRRADPAAPPPRAAPATHRSRSRYRRFPNLFAAVRVVPGLSRAGDPSMPHLIPPPLCLLGCPSSLGRVSFGTCFTVHLLCQGKGILESAKLLTVHLLLIVLGHLIKKRNTLLINWNPYLRKYAKMTD
jgi:hypothetical protein